MNETTYYTITLADGLETVTGPVHGSGGVLGSRDLPRLRREIHLANEGRALGIFEPLPGHCRVWTRYSAEGTGPGTDVDLRGATAEYTEAKHCIEVYLGPLVASAAHLDDPGHPGFKALDNCNPRTWRIGRIKVQKLFATRASLTELLYYVEAAIASSHDDHHTLRAVRQTVRTWRAKLGMFSSERTPVPASATTAPSALDTTSSVRTVTP